MFSNLSGSVNNSYHTGKAKNNNNNNFSLFEPIKTNLLLLPTKKKEEKSLGGTKLILVVVQISAVSCPMLGTWEVHSTAATVQLILDLPRTKAVSLGRSVEVPVKSGCILPRQCL